MFSTCVVQFADRSGVWSRVGHGPQVAVLVLFSMRRARPARARGERRATLPISERRRRTPSDGRPATLNNRRPSAAPVYFTAASWDKLASANQRATRARPSPPAQYTFQARLRRALIGPPAAAVATVTCGTAHLSGAVR